MQQEKHMMCPIYLGRLTGCGALAAVCLSRCPQDAVAVHTGTAALLQASPWSWGQKGGAGQQQQDQRWQAQQ
jgi:hypothetical protein